MKNTRKISALALIAVTLNLFAAGLVNAQIPIGGGGGPNYQFNWPNSTNPQTIQITNSGVEIAAMGTKTSDGNYLFADIGSAGLYAYKVSATNGSTIWGSSQISSNLNADVSQVVPDNNGGAYIAYEDGTDAFINHIDSNGSPSTEVNLSTEFSIDLINARGSSVKLLPDGNNGVYFSFQLENFVDPNYKERAELGHFVLSNGNIITEPNWAGNVTSHNFLEIMDPDINYVNTGNLFMSDGTNFIYTNRSETTNDGGITWSYQIHIFKFDQNGNYTGFSNPNEVTNYSTNLTYTFGEYQTVSDGNGGVLMIYFSDGDATNLGGIGFDHLTDNQNGTASFSYGSEHLLYTYNNWNGPVYIAGLNGIDSNGNIIIGWTEWDDNSFTGRSFMQKFDASGAAQWLPTNGYNGVLLTPGANVDVEFGRAYPGLIVSDNNGGAIAVMRDYNNNVEVVQKVNSAGMLPWATLGSGIELQSNETNLSADGTGGVVAFWTQGGKRQPSNIAGQYITDLSNAPHANFTYSASGKTVTFTDTTTSRFGIVNRDWDFGDGGPHGTDQNPVHTYANFGTYNVTLTVTDDASGTANVTKAVAVVNSAGIARQWPNTGSPVDQQITGNQSQSYDETNPYVTRTADGGYFVAWQDANPEFQGDIAGEKLDSTGGLLWTVTVATGPLYQPSPIAGSQIQVVPDSTGGAYVGYVASNGTTINNNQYAVVSHIDSTSHSVDWSHTMPTGEYNANEMYIIADGNGGVYTAWKELIASNQSKYYISHYTSSGSTFAGFPKAVPRILDNLNVGDVSTVDQGQLVLASDGIIFVDRNHTYRSNIAAEGYSLLAQKWDTSGTAQWGTMEIFDGSNYVDFSSSVPDGSDGVNVYYVTNPPLDGHNYVLKAEKVTTAGSFGFNNGEGTVVKTYDAGSTVNGIQAYTDNAGGAVLVWNEFLAINLDEQEVFAQKVNSLGAPQWGNGVALSTANDGIMTNIAYFDKQSITNDGAGGAIVVMQKNDGVTQSGLIQRIKSDGSKDWGANDYNFSVDTPDGDFTPSLTYDGNNGAMAVWSSPVNTIQEIFAQDFRSGVAAPDNNGSCGVIGPNGTCGTQVISCNDTNGAQNFEVRTPVYPDANTVAFQTRTTDFYNSTNAPLDSNQFVQLYVSDTRGYDPSAINCGTGYSYTIQSNGLYLDGNTANQRLALRLGRAVGIEKFAWDTVFGPNSPVNVSDVFNADVTAPSNDLSTAVQVTHTNEAFLGRVIMTLDGSDLEVIKPAASIPAGNYSGTITFTQI